MSNILTRRTCLSILTALPFLTATKSLAMFATMPNEDLVEGSALIVTATLSKIEVTSGASPRRIGTLSIQTVLKGQSDLHEVQLALPGGGGFISSSDVDYPVNSTGLWFLRSLEAQTPELFAADSPQRFVPETEVAGVVSAIGDYLPK